ncbi:hypothetical protein [Sphingomonas olei]|jgi:hypothetical protein|uniref:Resolvase/invertase-type recombinase catalytic domain-containing protein n=1 Tax=Sphingomonas olei TaxID=1886787 RepID=A0ABY2QD18_9SPHN|nr:hypothetical protein [Sphingomonas olei]THG36803.1 hypothetical protein E5988_16510 [Sphingomonas olei]
MNDIAVIFQRSSIATAKEREAEAARLERYAASRNLKVVSVYVASGEPNMLTIDMLINHCMAREKPGHVIVTALSRLWDGDNPATIISMVERAGAIVHVVPEEFP